MCEQDHQNILENPQSNNEVRRHRKRKRGESNVDAICWKCFKLKAKLKCSKPQCEQLFHRICLSEKERGQLHSRVEWKCPDCELKERCDATDQCQLTPQNVKVMYECAESILKKSSDFHAFMVNETSTLQKLKDEKYESAFDFVLDLKTDMVAFFKNHERGGSSRRLAKKLLTKYQKDLVQPQSIDENQIICSFTSQVKSLAAEKNVFKERLKAAVQESNRTKDDLKKISELNDRLLLEKTELQSEKGHMLAQFDKKWRKAPEEKGLLQSKLSKYEQMAYDLSILRANNEKLRNENTQLQTERLTRNEQIESELTASKTECNRLAEIMKFMHIRDSEQEKAIGKLMQDLRKLSEEKDALLTQNASLHSEKERLLASKLKSASECLRNHCKTKDELLKLRANFEILQNEKKLLGKENERLAENLKNVSKERDSLVTENERFPTPAEMDKIHVRAEFQDRLHAALHELKQLKSSSNADLERMTNSFNGLKNDLLAFKANFEKLRNEKVALDETNRKLRFELERVEQDSLKWQKDHVKLQAEFNMESSMAKIQFEAMKGRSLAIDAQNIRLNSENTKLEQQVDELQKAMQQDGVGGLSSRIKALQQECANLKKEKDIYRARWKYVKSKLLLNEISFAEESD